MQNKFHLAAAIAAICLIPVTAIASDDGFQSEVEQYKQLARKKSKLEAELKVAELQQKLADLQKKPATSAAPAMPAGMPQAMQAPSAAMPSVMTSNAYVTRVTAYGGNATALISTDSGAAYYGIGDSVPGAGKIKSIDIRGVVVCQPKKPCRTIPLQTSAPAMTAMSAMPAPNGLPPVPPPPTFR